ncbi:hypothetical protein Esti_001904 [Eimeria stiedai]
MRGDNDSLTRVCSHSNASCHAHGPVKERPNAEAGHVCQRGAAGSSAPQPHAHSHPPAVKLCVEGSYGRTVNCEEGEGPLASQDASAGSTLRAVPVRTPQFSNRRADRSCDSGQPHPACIATATPRKTLKSPFQSAALLDKRGSSQAGASTSPVKARLAGTHRVSPRGQGGNRACKQPTANHLLTSGHLHPQRVLPSRVLRAAASLALLLVLQVWQVAVACWWQSVREALCVCGESCRRCSFGFQVAAAGLLRRVPDARGWRTAALSGCVKLLQVPGDLLRSVAARAAEASYSAAAATQAARATALGTAQAVGSKWSLISRGGRAAARQAVSKAPLSAPPLAEAPSLQLTPEEALATGKQTEAQLTRWSCDLWASIHRESPSQHVGVLQFQELLRKRLTAKDGSLYLLLANLEDEQQAACGNHEASAHVAYSQHQPVACGQQKSASVQPHTDTHQGKKGALRRTAQSMVYACRLALVSWGVLVSLLALPFQQPAPIQAKSRTMVGETLSRNRVFKLTKQGLVFTGVNYVKSSSPCSSAGNGYFTIPNVHDESGRLFGKIAFVLFPKVILKELRMECGVAFAATKRLLKFARRSVTWVPMSAARLARSTSSAVAAVSIVIPWETLCAMVGWTRGAVAARHARSGTAAVASSFASLKTSNDRLSRVCEAAFSL